MSVITDIMEAHDAVTRPYMTENWALDWEVREHQNLQRSIRERAILPVYVIDGEVILSVQMAAYLQYRAKEMWCVYFAGGRSKKPAGTILKIRKVNPGDI